MAGNDQWPFHQKSSTGGDEQAVAIISRIADHRE